MWMPINIILAEREGFEPSVRLHVQRFSRPPHSTTLPPLRDRGYYQFEESAAGIIINMTEAGPELFPRCNTLLTHG